MTNQVTSHVNGKGSSHPTPPAAKSSKKQALLLHHKQQLQQQQSHQPWLFQSSNVLHTAWGTTSPPALPSQSLSLFTVRPERDVGELSPASPAPFYLDVESLRALLPVSIRKTRPRSSEDSRSRHETYGSAIPRINRNQRQLPVRLEALSPAARGRGRDPADAPAGIVAQRRTRRPKNRARSARPISVHRKFALRIDAARARGAHQPAASPSKKRHLPHSKNRDHHRHLGLSSFDENDDGRVARALTPPPPLEDIDEERRQKAAIASQLGLSLEEYEALDAAFGGGGGGNDEDEYQGSMTDRYHAVFAQYDVDGSGAISPAELESLLKAAGEDMDDTELSKVIAQADTDGDGEVNFDEFMGLMRARKRLLLVAKTMGVAGTGPSGPTISTTSKSSSNSWLTGQPSSLPGASSMSPLPPLKLAVAQSKKHLAQSQFNRNYTRPTPSCLRPGTQVDMTQLRRELAIAEFGIQELNSKVRDGVQWVQQHCPVNSLKAQIYCHRWGIEKVQQLLLRLQSQSLSRAYQKWKGFLMYERNKVKANLFLKCKGSQKMTEIMTKWKRKALRRRFFKWKTECAIDARNEIHAAALELQRVWRGKLARLWRCRCVERRAATTIQSLVRGHLGRCRVRRRRRVQLEHDCACILQRCYRGYSGKRLAKALFKAQRESLAARRIQRAFRNHQKRRLLRQIQRTKLEHDSAVQLQCCLRSYLARKERRSRSHQRRRVRSSIVVQRHTRGLLARREFERKKRREAAAVIIQTRCRAYRSRWQFFQMRSEKADLEQRAREREAATAIQAQWRRAHARKTYITRKLQLCEAQRLLEFQRLASARRIQSLFRGYCARRQAQRLRYEKLKWMNLTLMNRCALRIQACWRGYHGRLASHLRVQARRALEHEENEAAKRIQSIARGKLARHELERREAQRAQVVALQHKRTRSALQIQKVVRGTQARKRALKLKRDHEDHARAALERLVRQTKTRAAIKIQCCARFFLARLKYRKRKQEAERKAVENARRLKREQAAMVIQCMVRRARARRLLRLRRREFEKRISTMASEKAYDEIERLREEQEAELAKLRVQLLFQENKATEESSKLRRQLEAQLEEEKSRRDQEAQELAKLKLESMMQQHVHVSDRTIVECQRQHDADKLREQLEKRIKEQKELEQLARTQENEALATLKITALLQTSTKFTGIDRAHDKEMARLERETGQLTKATQAMRREQARLKIQSVCLNHIARRRIQKLHEEQTAVLAQLHSEDERVRVKALQEKEMAVAKLKAMMDDDARAREQEIKAMEAQMLERARLERERIAKRNAAARRIQASARGHLGRQHVKAVQQKIEKEREERAKALADQLAAAEAKVAEAMNGIGEPGDVSEAEMEPSAAGSAEEWVEYWDDNAQASYFFNIKTQEASWTRPFSATSSSKTMETATSPTVDYDGDAYSAGYSASGQIDANGYSAAGYADEYGFYDQYGQYHYYDDGSSSANAYAAGNNTASMQAAMAAGMMYPGYAAAAAAYAYQTAITFGGNPMMFGATTMHFNQQLTNPMLLNATAASATSTEADAAGYAVTAESAVPPDPWEKYFDQYTGAAYYYNSITGKKFWA